MPPIVRRLFSLAIVLSFVGGCASVSIFKTQEQSEKEQLKTWEGKKIVDVLNEFGLFDSNFEGENGSTFYAYRIMKPEGFCLILFRATPDGIIIETKLRRLEKKHKHGLRCLD